MVRNSHCSTMGSMVSWECWNAGLTSSLAQWVGDLALQLRLGSDPCLGNSICCWVAKKEKKKSTMIFHGWAESDIIYANRREEGGLLEKIAKFSVGCVATEAPMGSALEQVV